MPDTKKETKPNSKKSRSAAKPKQTTGAVSAAKPAVKAGTKAGKASPEKPMAIAPQAKDKQSRAYTRKAKGSFAELIKKQAELEEIKKGAKADLKKQYDDLLKDAAKVGDQYKLLFGDSIASAPKAKAAAGAKKAAGKLPGAQAFSRKEVDDFIDQKKAGAEVKIDGRRLKSIARMEAAYNESQDADEILRILNK